MAPDDSIRTLAGIGPKKEELFKKLGISTLSDLLFFFPRDYQDRRFPVPIAEIRAGDTALIKATVGAITNSKFTYGRKRVLRIRATDYSGSIAIVYFNAAFIANNLSVGEEYFFYGRVSENRGAIQMVHPEFSKHADGIVPVYPLTTGISQNDIRKYEKALRPLVSEIEEYMPDALLREKGLVGIDYALENIHFPKGTGALNESRYRLIYDELLMMQLGMQMMKAPAAAGYEHRASAGDFIDSLPYNLTAGQMKAAGEIADDLESPRAMNRLLQGDVGSGKTAVAEASMFKVAKSGAQSVFMAPTELLARQHYATLTRDFERFEVRVDFLSGHMNATERKKVLDALEKGETDILVGTHAVLQPDVIFKKLGLVITDEQHRFGVNQRIELYKKGEQPDVLVMTATPIPRTLAIALYGDMDVSVIDEMPPGRKPVITKTVTDKKRDSVYNFAEGLISEGQQVYVVCPLIEESESIEARSAISVYEELTRRFSGRNIALLHGEMKQEEKDLAMQAFAAGEIDILVSTIVIEVGIDVPGATCMIIENAERFGLAQMHQLRGRVGRGKDQSYCVLILGSKTDIALERCKVMTESTDGFYIAERDLDLRGPGEIFGTRQHGIPDMHLADIVRHMDIMNEARDVAMRILAADPALEKGEHKALKARVIDLFGENPAASL